MQIGEEEFYKSNIFYFLKSTYGDEYLNSHIRITASSHYPGSEANRELIPTVLEYNDGRWVSENLSDSYFIIEFLSGHFEIQSYTLKWSSKNRYNTKWKVEGFFKSEWTTIDSRNDESICPNKSDKSCLVDIYKLFAVQNPSRVTKLKFSGVGIDSYGDSIFSLTQVLIFGQYKMKFTHDAHIMINGLMTFFCTNYLKLLSF